MARRKKIKWNNGDVFLVPLQDGRFSVGQVLDLRLQHCVRCALYDEIINNVSTANINSICKDEDLVSLAEFFRDNLDYGEWPIVGNKPISIPKEKYPNERYNHQNDAGARTYTPEVAEDLMNAFYALIPWNQWYRPDLLDEMLINSSKKPINLIYIKSAKP